MRAKLKRLLMCLVVEKQEDNEKIAETLYYHFSQETSTKRHSVTFSHTKAELLSLPSTGSIGAT